MGDFEPRMDKWRSGPVVEDLGLQFKDAIANKGRVQRMHKAAAKQAAKRRRRIERKARWKASPFRAKMWWFIRLVLLALIGMAVLNYFGFISA